MRRTAAALVLAVALPAAVPLAQDRKPNIILIMADDLGYGELGCYGQQKIKTPNIDQLCSQGMKFTDYYAGSTVCAPSRSVLMTGQHMGHTWVRGNAGQDHPAAQSLRPEDVIIPEVLKEAGYTTGITGKWGLGDMVGGAMEGLPNRQGFDFFFGYFNQRHAHNYYPSFLYRNEERIALPNEGDFDPTGAGVAAVKKVYAHDLILDESLKFLESAARGDKPFFLYLSWTLPHANNEANRAIKNGTEVPHLGLYGEKDWSEQNKGHAAMITYLDTQVGKVLETLKRHGLEKDTVVFFTSDNGPHREGGNDPVFFNSDGAVRGIKRDLYDGGIRVPMIVRWPRKVKAGSVTGHVAYHGDMMATLAEITGARPPKNIDSISFLPTLLGKGDRQEQHKYLYWEFYEGGSKQAVRMGKWKAVRMPMITGEIELYDLSQDLKEQNNIASKHPGLVKQMGAIMDEAHLPNPNWKVPRGK